MDDITWETRSIVLGIIYFLSNGYHFGRNVIIDNRFYRLIARELFPRLIIKKKGEGLEINIQKKSDRGIQINNLQNLDKIRGERVYMLPWYNQDNPIVAFITGGDEDISISKTQERIKKFTKKKRNIRHYPETVVDQLSGYNNWDSETEYEILEKYANKSRTTSEEVYLLISQLLCRSGCGFNTVVPIPVEVKKRIDIEMPKIKREKLCPIKSPERRKMIEKPVEKTPAPVPAPTPAPTPAPVPAPTPVPTSASKKYFVPIPIPIPYKKKDNQDNKGFIEFIDSVKNNIDAIDKLISEK